MKDFSLVDDMKSLSIGETYQDDNKTMKIVHKINQKGVLIVITNEVG